MTVAVRERLERLRHESGAGLGERLLTIGRDCAARLKEPYRSADPLYNERGFAAVIVDASALIAILRKEPGVAALLWELHSSCTAKFQ